MHLKKHRILVVESVYFQPANASPVGVESRFGRELISDDEPYERRQPVGREWAALDSGWLKDSAMAVLSNPAPVWQRIPTPEQLAEAMAKVVEVIFLRPAEHPNCYNMAPPSGVVIPPGESARLRPSSLGSTWLRCPSLSPGEKVKLGVFLVPA